MHKRKRRKIQKRYANRQSVKCEGYTYDKSKQIWIRVIRDGCVWCMDCGEWKLIEQFSKMRGELHRYCRGCRRIQKAMSTYDLTREEVVNLLTNRRCLCCNCEFEKQAHKHIHHVNGEVIGLLCLYCNHTLRNESPEHLHRLRCCVRFIESRMKIE